MSEFNNLSPEDAEYVLNLPYHLSEAGMSNELYDILIDFEYIEYKASQQKLQELINDYDFSNQPTTLLPTQGWVSLELIQKVIRLSAHIVEEDISKLAGQLLGRLPKQLSARQQILEQAKCIKTTLWLRPLLPSLISPDNRLQRILIGHARTVTAVAVSLNGRRAVSAAVDGTMRIWNMETGEMLAKLGVRFRETDGLPEKSPVGLAVTPDSKWAASVSRGDRYSELKIWNLETLQEEDTVPVSIGTGFALAIAPDGQRVITIQPEYICIWKRGTRELEYIWIANHRSTQKFAMTPDGKQVITASEDHSLKVWGLQMPALLHTLRGHLGLVTALAVTADGQQVVSGSVDRTLKVWDLRTGQLLQTLENCAGEVTSLAVTPDSRKIISASKTPGRINDGVFQVWDLASGAELYRFKELTSHATAIAVMPSGWQIVSASTDNTLKIWDIASEVTPTPDSDASNWVKYIALAASEQLAITFSMGGLLKAWNLATGSTKLAVNINSGEIKRLLVTSDEQQVIFTTTENSLQFWNLTTGAAEQLSNNYPGIILALTSNSHWAILAQGSVIDILDLKTRRFVHQFLGHTDRIFAAIELDGQRVCSISEGGIRIWNLVTGQLHQSFDRNNTNVLSATVTLDRLHIIFVSSNNSIEVWSLFQGRQTLALKGDTTWVRSTATTPDGRFVVCASQAFLEIWDLTTGNKLHTLHGHTDVREVTVTPDGKRFVTVSEQHDCVKVWDLRSGQLIDDFRGDTRLWTANITKDGKTVIVGEQSGRVHFLRLEGVE